MPSGAVFAKRCQVIEELGAGGMGRVYRVLDKKLGEALDCPKKPTERCLRDLRKFEKM